MKILFKLLFFIIIFIFFSSCKKYNFLALEGEWAVINTNLNPAPIHQEVWKFFDGKLEISFLIKPDSAITNTFYKYNISLGDRNSIYIKEAPNCVYNGRWEIMKLGADKLNILMISNDPKAVFTYIEFSKQ